MMHTTSQCTSGRDQPLTFSTTKFALQFRRYAKFGLNLSQSAPSAQLMLAATVCEVQQTQTSALGSLRICAKALQCRCALLLADRLSGRCVEMTSHSAPTLRV